MSGSRYELFFVILLVLQAAWSLKSFTSFATKRISILFSVPANTKVEGSNVQVARPLGSYEKLLSRQVPGSTTLALSHGCRVVLSTLISDEELRLALTKCIERFASLTNGPLI